MIIVPPPKRSFIRPRTWETFEALFQPIISDDGTVLRERWEIPGEADPRYWWTVLDCDGRLLLAAGFRFVNRFAFVACRKAWGGERDEHPNYRYD